MPIAPYDPCPCGSGKKIKFCCQAIVGEMDRVTKMEENNQQRMALQALSRLEEKHPDNPWVLTRKASLLFDDNQAEEARLILKRVIDANPDHTFATALYAGAMFVAESFLSAKPAIYRAFQRCSAACPEIVGSLALGIAGEMQTQGRFMAARQHLALAMRVSAPENRQQIFLLLLEIDGNGQIPYPMRGGHQLVEYQGEEAAQADAGKAMRLSQIGCWEAAANIYTKLAEEQDTNPALWRNAGLCRAWDGDEQAAAKALHRAAELIDDFSSAVECETLAQLLDLNTTDDRVQFIQSQYRVETVSKLLTDLDGSDRLVRAEREENADDENSPAVAGIYRILDRVPTLAEGEELTSENIPTVLGQITVFAAEKRTGEAPECVIVAQEGADHDAADQLLTEIAGDDIKPVPPEEADDDPVIDWIPREMLGLDPRWFVPAGTPIKESRQLTRQHFENFVNNVWTETELSILGGKTPLQAAGNDDDKLKLTAAVFALDAFCDRDRRCLNVKDLLERLQLERLPKFELSAQTPLNSLSVMQLNRVALDELSDPELTTVLNRALLIHQGLFLYGVLQRVVERADHLQDVNLGRVYMSLVELCLDRFERDEALEWLERGKGWVKEQENAFEAQLHWEFRELRLRLEDPDDPQLRPLLKHMWDYYGTKVPQIRSALAAMSAQFGIEPPWNAGVEGATTEQDGIWTPGGEASQPTGESQKLWIPGQE